MKPLHASSNPLQHIHQLLTSLPLAVKQRVCTECSWSQPTYYRKVKALRLSNAEKEKIINVLFEHLQQTWKACKHGDNPPPAGGSAPR